MPAAASTANRTAQVQSPTGPRSPIKKPLSKDTTRSPEKSKSPARSPAPEPEPESLDAGLLAIRKDYPSYHVHGLLPFATAEEWEKAKAEGAPLYMPEDIKKTMFYAEFYNFTFYTDCVDHEVANKSGEILDLLTKVTYGRAVYYDAETRKAVSLHQGVICCNINIAHTRRGCVNNHWKESNDTYERIITIQNVAECVSEIQRKAKRLVEAEGAQAEALSFTMIPRCDDTHVSPGLTLRTIAASGTAPGPTRRLAGAVHGRSDAGTQRDRIPSPSDGERQACAQCRQTLSG